MKAYILAWINYKNLGDEAGYAAIRQILDPSIELVHLEDRRTIEDGELPSIVLCGCGTLIHMGLDSRMLVIHRALTRGCPVAILGSGVVMEPRMGGKPHEMSPHVLHCLNMMPVVGVRGPLSKQRLEDQGFMKSTVIGDPAFLLEPRPDSPRENNNRIAINIGDTTKHLFGMNEDMVMTEMVKLVEMLDDYKIFYTPLWDRDAPYLEQLRDRTNTGTVLPWNPDFFNLMKFYRTCKVVIGEKLHASVLAAAACVPFIGLAYQEKVNDFAASLELSDYAIRTDEPDLANKVMDKIGKLNTENDRISCMISTYKMKYRSLHSVSAAKVFDICKSRS